MKRIINFEYDEVYYGIRHKSTGQLMPQAKRDRGYSNWNPDNIGKEFFASLGYPRILQSIKQARRVIAQWNAIPNGKSDMDGDTDIRDDGRKKEDLEVVKITLTIENLKE